MSFLKRTGVPFSVAGRYFQSFAAFSRRLSYIGWIAFRNPPDITRPCSSMTISRKPRSLVIPATEAGTFGTTCRIATGATRPGSPPM